MTCYAMLARALLLVLAIAPVAVAQESTAFKLIATAKTSTLQKELDQLGAAGYEAVAMTVGQTAMGGAEIVVIGRKALR